MVLPRAARYEFLDIGHERRSLVCSFCLIPALVFNAEYVFPFIICRFHKEALAGEPGNYISNRAYVEGTSALQVLEAVVEELFDAKETILAALGCTGVEGAVEVWETFEAGYMYVVPLLPAHWLLTSSPRWHSIWHLEQDRYKLANLGL